MLHQEVRHVSDTGHTLMCGRPLQRKASRCWRKIAIVLIDPVVSAIAGLRQLTAVSNKAVVLGSRDATLITSFAVAPTDARPVPEPDPAVAAES
jgi:hypothetical protein